MAPGARQRRAAGAERPRGHRKTDPRDVENAALRRRAERAEAELEKARKVIEEVQGNVSALLRARRGQLTHPPYAAPELLAEAPERGVLVGHHQAQGPGERGRPFSCT